MFAKSAMKLLTAVLIGLSLSITTVNAGVLLDNAIRKAILEKRQTKKVAGANGRLAPAH